MMYMFIIFYIGTVNGDISFGGVNRPVFQFIGTLLPTSPPARFITFEVKADDIIEGQEIGLLKIVAPSTFSDGFVPRFQSVRIIIDDSNSKL